MRALIGCEESATVRDAFRARGIDAYSCDLQGTRGDSAWHITGDRANQTDSGQNRLGPSPTRAMVRATTYPGIAAAMADQWGNL